MLLCDGCDKGFHTHCVQLRAIPEGAWHCRRCRRALGLRRCYDSTAAAALPTPLPNELLLTDADDERGHDAGAAVCYY